MDNILKPLRNICVVYVDDILIYSDTEEQHLKDIELILQNCFEAGVVISKKKAVINQQKIKFLGLEIDQGNLSMQAHVLNNIQNFPSEIKDKTQLQRFLGCLTYAEGYSKKLAELRKPLQGKLKKNATWHWTEEDTKYMDKVNRQVKDLPVLYHPKPDGHMIIETDASREFWGAV